MQGKILRVQSYFAIHLNQFKRQLDYFKNKQQKVLQDIQNQFIHLKFLPSVYKFGILKMTLIKHYKTLICVSFTLAISHKNYVHYFNI